MAQTARRTPAQAAIARRIAIRRRIAAKTGVATTRPSAPKSMNSMMAACIAAAGFSEHAAR